MRAAGLLVITTFVVLPGAGTSAAATATPACELPTVSVSATDQYEGSGAGTNRFAFTVRVSQSGEKCAGAGEVRFRTLDGSASAGGDYTATTGVISWQAPTSREIDVPVQRDFVPELDEDFSVELFAPRGAVITTARATATVFNDDKLVEQDFPGVETSFTPAGGICWWPDDPYLWLPLEMNVIPKAPVTVTFYSKDGTAVAGKHYELAASTVTFQEGASKAGLPIAILDGAEAAKPDFHVVIKDVTAGVVVGETAKVTIEECRPQR